RLEPSEKTAPPVRLALARGALHLAADEAHEAIAAFEEARSWSSRLSEGAAPMAEIPLGLGRAHARLGDLEAAHGHLEEALSTARRSEDQAALAEALYRLAELEQKRERWGEAEALLQQAVEVVEARYPPEHPRA